LMTKIATERYPPGRQELARKNAMGNQKGV
jgi:hypothetical protein